MLGVDEDDPTLRNLHRHLKLPDDVPIVVTSLMGRTRPCASR